jgi:hypothetical protein
MTLDLIRLLVRRVPQLAAAIIATFRDDEAAANPELGLLLGDLTSASRVRRIDLRPLSGTAVGELQDRAASTRPSSCVPPAATRSSSWRRSQPGAVCLRRCATLPWPAPVA